MHMSENVAAEIGRRIRQRREYLAKSQEEVARGIGVGRSNLSQIESGNVRISAVDLVTLATILKVRPSYFFEDEGANADESEALILFRSLPRHIQPMALAILRAIHENAPTEG
jgi:transcriptional regulator with XRE-family HTH domain